MRAPAAIVVGGFGRRLIRLFPVCRAARPGRARARALKGAATLRLTYRPAPPQLRAAAAQADQVRRAAGRPRAAAQGLRDRPRGQGDRLHARAPRPAEGPRRVHAQAHHARLVDGQGVQGHDHGEAPAGGCTAVIICAIALSSVRRSGRAARKRRTPTLAIHPLNLWPRLALTARRPPPPPGRPRQGGPRGRGRVHRRPRGAQDAAHLWRVARPPRGAGRGRARGAGRARPALGAARAARGGRAAGAAARGAPGARAALVGRPRGRAAAAPPLRLSPSPSFFPTAGPPPAGRAPRAAARPAGRRPRQL